MGEITASPARLGRMCSRPRYSMLPWKGGGAVSHVTGPLFHVAAVLAIACCSEGRFWDPACSRLDRDGVLAPQGGRDWVCVGAD